MTDTIRMHRLAEAKRCRKLAEEADSETVAKALIAQAEAIEKEYNVKKESSTWC